MISKLAWAFALIAVLAACQSNRQNGGNVAPSADVERNAADCRQIAYERVQNLPAVRSGKTAYIPGGASPYYQSCMKQRGFWAFPAC